MTKDELIAALQADPSPGGTPVVRRMGEVVFLDVNNVKALRISPIHFGAAHGPYTEAGANDAIPVLSLS